MSAFSFSHFSSFHLCILFVVPLFHSCLSNQNFDNVLCIKEERQALLQFKHRLIDETYHLVSWDYQKNDCCKWAGVVCDNMTGHVHHIHLRALGLKGDLSPSLLGLKHLDLSCNDFGWIQVPEFIGSLGNLRYLNLSSSNFSGLIPPQLGNISELNLEWLSNLRLLRYLDMSNVDLSKAMDCFQVINTVPSLTELHLRYTNLLDAHPHVPIHNITSLLLLDLSGNTYMNSSLVLKELSSGIGSNLISLDISQCDISSTALDSLHNLTSLHSLDLSMNQLTSIMPKSLGNLCNLRDIDLSSNNFQNISLTSLLGSFLECKSPHLESLHMKDVKLSGTIPESIGRLSFLRTLDLSENQIYGQIPFSIGRSSVLEVLSLSDNQLNGSLPDSIGQLSLLKSLNLSRNHLTGRIPEKIGDLKELESFDLSLNKLSGELPRSLSGLNWLSSFNVSYNNLIGKIPSSSQLQSFDESCFVGNKFCGDPLSEPCSRVKTPDTDGVDWGLIVSVVFGFIVGFWVILAPLELSRSWRIAYFRFLSELRYMVYDVTHKMFSW